MAMVQVYNLAALDSKAGAGALHADVPHEAPWEIGDIGGFFQETQPNDGREHLRVLAFDCRGCAMGIATLSIGTPVSCEVSIRDVLRFAVSIPGSVAFAVSHNHPSGQCEPSDADKQVTRNLRTAAEHCGLALICHVVTGRDSWALADDELDPGQSVEWDEIASIMGNLMKLAPGPMQKRATVPSKVNPDLGAKFGMKERG
jgi:hypothetical protein